MSKRNRERRTAELGERMQELEEKNLKKQDAAAARKAQEDVQEWARHSPWENVGGPVDPRCGMRTIASVGV